jgi:iron complex outermembrane receptor protein
MILFPTSKWGEQNYHCKQFGKIITLIPNQNPKDIQCKSTSNMATFLRVLAVTILFIISSNILLSQNRKDSIAFEYLADTTILLEAITVDAYQVNSGLRTVPGSLSILVGSEITLTDGVNLATSLNTLPGVTMQSGTYATNRIVIRGMGSRTPYNTNRIKAYLNNIPITSADGISAPEEIDILGLGRIEVIKGPVSALYGSGLGGTINLYSPTSRNSQGSIVTQYGSFQTSKANISGNSQGERGSIWGSLSHLKSDGYRENNHLRRTSLISTGNLYGSKLSASYTFLVMDVNAGIPSSLNKTQFYENPQGAAPNWLAINGYKAYSKGLLGVTLKGKISQNVTNRLTFFGSITDSYEKRPFNYLDDQSQSSGLRNKLTYHTQKTDWVFGVELISDTYKWLIDKDEILLSKNKENRNQLNAFGLAYHRFNDKIIATMAIAANYISYSLTDKFLDDGDLSVRRIFPLIISPRVGINYAPNNSWAFYASAGQGFSMPSPEETLLPEGNVNPDLEPEQGWQFEFGSRFTPSTKLVEFDFTLYWIELSNLLLTKRITEDIFTGINAGKTRHQGLEIQMKNNLLNLKVFPGKARTTLSYYTSINRFINFTDDNIDHSGNNLPGIPNQTMQMQLEWNPIKLLSINMHWQYHGDQFLDDENNVNYSGYNLGNIRVTSPLTLKKNWLIDIYFGVNNVTNTQYASMVVPNAVGFGGAEPRYYYPGLPRHFYGGIRLGF